MFYSLVDIHAIFTKSHTSITDKRKQIPRGKWYHYPPSPCPVLFHRVGKHGKCVKTIKRWDQYKAHQKLPCSQHISTLDLDCWSCQCLCRNDILSVLYSCINKRSHLPFAFFILITFATTRMGILRIPLSHNEVNILVSISSKSTYPGKANRPQTNRIITR